MLPRIPIHARFILASLTIALALVLSSCHGNNPSADLSAPPVLQVSGTIVGARLTPVEGFVVTINSVPPFVTTTGPDGAFTADLQTGEYELEVLREGFPVHKQKVSVSLPGPIVLGNIQVLTLVTGQIVDGLLVPIKDGGFKVSPRRCWLSHRGRKPTRA